MTDTMEFELKKRHKVSIEIDIVDIIDRMNKLELDERWILIAKILNHIETKDIEKLKPGAKHTIIKFLQDKLKFYGNTNKNDTDKQR